MYSEIPGNAQLESSTFEDQNDIQKFLYLLWQKALMIIGIAVLSGVAAFFLSKQLTPIYKTTTDLLIIEGSTSGTDYQDVLSSERLTRTISDMMLNQDILQEVIDLYDLQTDVEALRKTIEVGSIHDTQLITVTVEGPDSRLIADIANSMVSVFINRINVIQEERYSSSLETLSKQMNDIELILQDINNQIIILEDKIATLTPESGSELEIAEETNVFQQYLTEKENLEAQAIQYQQIYADLLTSYEQTRLAETQSSANIIQVNEAIPPLKPISQLFG